MGDPGVRVSVCVSMGAPRLQFGGRYDRGWYGEGWRRWLGGGGGGRELGSKPKFVEELERAGDMVYLFVCGSLRFALCVTSHV